MNFEFNYPSAVSCIGFHDFPLALVLISIQLKNSVQTNEYLPFVYTLERAVPHSNCFHMIPVVRLQPTSRLFTHFTHTIEWM